MKRRVARHIAIWTVIAFIVAALVVCFQVFRIMRTIREQTGLTPTTIVRLAFDSGAPLRATDGRINILLLGAGGGAHEGADLTDTIMVVSVDTGKGKVSLLSIPRDIWSDSLKDKVNSAYHYGEEKKVGGGLTLAKAIMEDVTGLPIHYAMYVEFSHFVSMIDAIGGIDVAVSEGFVDKEYPIEGRENDDCGGDPTYACRYETITFTVGIQHMDGTRALSYVRSRHAKGSEGTDFARGRRQQDVLVAVKAKLMAVQPWFHPALAISLWQQFDKATTTDMTIGEMLTVGKTVMRMGGGQAMRRISLESQLENPPVAEYGRWVLIPKDDFQTLHRFVRQQLEGND